MPTLYSQIPFILNITADHTYDIDCNINTAGFSQGKCVPNKKAGVETG